MNVVHHFTYKVFVYVPEEHNLHDCIVEMKTFASASISFSPFIMHTQFLPKLIKLCGFF